MMTVEEYMTKLKRKILANTNLLPNRVIQKRRLLNDYQSDDIKYGVYDIEEIHSLPSTKTVEPQIHFLPINKLYI